ncbi:MAG: hypothetical protein AB1295_02940 [Candidatus Micrarchaeota archaeon]
MKAAMLMLLFVSLSMAQFEEFDRGLAQCQMDCCDSYSGSWDGSIGYCSLEGSQAEFDFYGCSNACMETGGKSLEGYGIGGLCCGPGALLLGLALAALRR